MLARLHLLHRPGRLNLFNLQHRLNKFLDLYEIYVDTQLNICLNVHRFNEDNEIWAKELDENDSLLTFKNE